MSRVYDSLNYFWTGDDLLGEGAAGTVYRAIHKKTGEFYAVKTFSLASRLLPRDIRMREFDILSRLDHQNIVQLLAIEEETFSGNKVLVMELCSGGSLLDLLSEPRNACGLDETEYLRVQCHMASGLRHLREQGIVHRDIKPGNIMRFITDDGQSIYKLADFGAARELQPEEEFKTLCGTEEYLYPDLYKKAILHSPGAERSFSASVDLWSVGVTLYHAAAGQLPFRPYGGRNSREMMYQITTQKESGVISGVQREENRPIEWSRDLPDACQLSRSLRALVTPLLAGLMESNPRYMWDFEHFFDEVNVINNKRVMYVFIVKSSFLLHVYVDEHYRLSDLQKQISSETFIKVEEQVLLFDMKRIDNNDNDDISNSIFQTTSLNPVFLFTLVCADDKIQRVDIAIPQLPLEATGESLEGDFRYSVGCCEVVYFIRRSASDGFRNKKLLKQSAKMFCDVMTQEADRLHETLENVFVISTEMKQRLLQYVRSVNTNRQMEAHFLGQGTSGDCDDDHKKETRVFFRTGQETFERLYSDVQRLKANFDACQSRLRTDKYLNEFLKEDCTNNSTEPSLMQLDHLIGRIERTQKEFRGDRKKRSLPREKQLLHKFGKQSLTKNIKKAETLLCDDMIPDLNKTFHSFQMLYSQIETIQKQLLIIKKDVTCLTRELHLFSAKLTKQQEQCNEHTEQLLRKVQLLQSNFPLSIHREQSPILSASLTTTSNETLLTSLGHETILTSLGRLTSDNTILHEHLIENDFVLITTNKDGDQKQTKTIYGVKYLKKGSSGELDDEAKIVYDKQNKAKSLQ